MNRKKILILAILLAFAATAGTYAYTFGLTASMSPSVFSADANIATYEPASYQPEWYSILAPIVNPAGEGEPPIVKVTGDVPIGDLFEITPHLDYAGDLMVTLYLTNTGAVNLAYQHLNIKAYITESLEAGETPPYQLLSLENGAAVFNIEGGSAASYTVEVIGGGYSLISGDPYQWREGWSITPEFYCEVTQR